MPWFRTLLWIGTIFLDDRTWYRKRIAFCNAHVATVEAFEFANKGKAKEYRGVSGEATGLLHTAKSNIRLDYVFMVFYVLLMINCSNHQMNLEQTLVLNNLLRFSIPLAARYGHFGPGRKSDHGA